MVPGSPYGIPIIRDDVAVADADKYINRATNDWNDLEIQFCPPTVNGKNITAPAVLHTFVNGKVVYWGPLEARDGDNKTFLSGTGSRGSTEFKPRDSGPIYLQSHWGSQVAFQKPDVQALTCPLPAK